LKCGTARFPIKSYPTCSPTPKRGAVLELCTPVTISTLILSGQAKWSLLAGAVSWFISAEGKEGQRGQERGTCAGIVPSRTPQPFFKAVVVHDWTQRRSWKGRPTLARYPVPTLGDRLAALISTSYHEMLDIYWSACLKALLRPRHSGGHTMVSSCKRPQI
jgi:hypothetical protein